MATKQETKTPPPVPQTPTVISDRSADSGLGFENFDPTKDQKIPFIQIIQKQSPECEKRDPKYIDGAEAGDLFNSATRKLYKVGEPEGKPIKFIPCGHIRVHNEWRKRSEGKGYVKTYLDNTQPETQDGLDGQKKVKELVKNTKHSLVETVMHHVIILDDEEGNYEAVLSMYGGSLGSSRDFTSKLRARKVVGGNGKYTPPVMDNLCELSTTLKQFNEGSAFIFVANIVGRTADDVYKEAKVVHQVSSSRLALMAPDAAQLQDKEEPTTSNAPY